MPERVTKEERRISLAIEKARSAKELLHQSLYDGIGFLMKRMTEWKKSKQSDQRPKKIRPKLKQMMAHIQVMEKVEKLLNLKPKFGGFE